MNLGPQRSLFDLPDPGAARHSDPETSKVAARAINASALEGRVVTFLKTHGPAILDEICAGLPEEKVSVSPRLAPLERAGYITRTGVSRVGRKRPQDEWRATEKQL